MDNSNRHFSLNLLQLLATIKQDCGGRACGSRFWRFRAVAGRLPVLPIILVLRFLIIRVVELYGLRLVAA